MASLPTIICLKSKRNGKYLRYKSENDTTHGRVQFVADTFMDPYAQFHVEKSEIGEGLVHIKCRYNNKYLVLMSPKSKWITASSCISDDNKSNWTCTLFKPVFIPDEPDSKNNIQLFHIHLGEYVGLEYDSLCDACLRAGITSHEEFEEVNNRKIVTVVDWESITRLPERVAFKGYNGLYLGAHTFNVDKPGLQFSFEDYNDPRVAQLIFTTPDGTVYVKSEHYNKFWRVGDDRRIVVDGEDSCTNDDEAAMFRLCVVDTNVVAVLNLKVSLFVKQTYNAVDEDLNNSAVADAGIVNRSSSLEVQRL